MKRRFQVMAAARADIADIRCYIAEETGPRTASAVTARLRKQIAFIRDNPFACAPQPDFGAHVRVGVSQRWSIYYEVTDEVCRILRILDGARDAAGVFERQGPL